MKKENVRLGLRQLYRNLDKILLLFLTVFVFMEVAWIPLNSWLADEFLSMTGATYLSYTNAVSVLTANPLATIGLVLLFFANLFLAYVQIGMLFIGVHQILIAETGSLKKFIQETGRKTWNLIGHFHITKALYLLLYAGILFPAMRKILQVRFFNKILLPEFIQTFLFTKPLFAVGLSLIFLGMIYLAIRWIYALPEILFEGQPVSVAIKHSWEKTKGKFWSTTWAVLWLLLKASLFFFGWGILLVFVQAFADGFDNTWSFVSAVVIYGLVKFLFYLATSYFLLRFVSFITATPVPAFDQNSGRRAFRAIFLTVSFLVFALQGFIVMVLPNGQDTITISHRGVDHENGVQNTIPALEKTAALKPDFIEMDIQETKDGKFVMMHDPNLKALADVDAKPQELTLDELTQITVRENGQEAKIPSFDEYLRVSDSMGQKLLIEIKTSSLDSPDMMERFLRQYGPGIIARGHQIHSLDYKVIEKVRAYSKEIPAYYILPYNTIFPQTKATGYTMEYTTLDDDFMIKARSKKKGVYAWTINDNAAILRAFNLGVDGIITDELTEVQTAIKEQKEDRTFANIISDELQTYGNIFE